MLRNIIFSFGKLPLVFVTYIQFYLDLLFSAAWKSALIYGGIALGALLILLIVGLLIYKKTHNDRVSIEHSVFRFL